LLTPIDTARRISRRLAPTDAASLASRGTPLDEHDPGHPSSSAAARAPSRQAGTGLGASLAT
jgi:hypothetical protein